MPDQPNSLSRHRSDVIIKVAFARVGVIALAVAAGALGAALLFLATAWLMLRGASPGAQVGPHLALLANYLPGYSVSWFGSLVGGAYGFVLGFCSGAGVGLCWNLIHYVYLLLLVGRDYSGTPEL